tara:strand:- start:185 stop:511 length:327 start_codon:yes stop_codon:yes gene_type:complete
MRLTCFCTTVKNIDTLRWLFSAIWLWTWETAVSTHDLTETSLTPAKFRGSLLLDTFNGVQRMLTCRRAVAHNLTWHLYHGHHLNSLATIVGYLLLSSSYPLEKAQEKA